VYVSSTSTGRAPALLAYISAGIFASASGALNVVYGWNKGTDLPSSITWAAVAAAVAIIFSLSWPALIRSLEARRWSAATMTLAALLLSGAYSVTAALGSAAGGRTDSATIETETTAGRNRAQAAYNAAQAELAKLPSTRPLGEIEALLAAAKPQCRVVVAHGYRDTVCAPPANLTAELARGKRRAELEAAAAHAAGQLAAIRPAKQANSDAVAMSRYLAAVGADIGPDRLNDLLVLLTVVLVECGAGLSLCVAQAAQSRPATSRPPPDQSDQPQMAGSTTRSTRPADHAGLVFASHRPVHERSEVLDWLAQQGGHAVTSRRRLAEQLGRRPTALHDELRRLAARGRITMMTGPMGTTLALANMN
jgi:hypothetical protein